MLIIVHTREEQWCPASKNEHSFKNPYIHTGMNSEIRNHPVHSHTSNKMGNNFEVSANRSNKSTVTIIINHT